MSKKIKKSSIIVGALLVYTTVIAFYFLVFSDKGFDMEYYLTIGFSYVIIYLLWIVLRRREKIAKKRGDSIINKKEK